MKIELKNRRKINLGELEAGGTFVSQGSRYLFQVLNMVQHDVFTADPPSLRPDLIYVVEVETGDLDAFPKTLEVEVVDVVVTEV